MIRSRRVEVARVGACYRAELTDPHGRLYGQGATAEEALVELAERLLDRLDDPCDDLHEEDHP